MSWAKLIARISGTAKTYGETHREIRADTSTHSLITIPNEHHEIHDGNSYKLVSYNDLAINAVYDIQFTTPNTAVECHLFWALECESETLFALYEGVTVVTPGTALAPRNQNRNSANASTMVVKGILNADVANANADTAVAGATLLSTGVIPAGNKKGGDHREDSEWVLKTNTIYCFRMVASAAGNITYRLNWYEHTPRT